MVLGEGEKSVTVTLCTTHRHHGPVYASRDDPEGIIEGRRDQRYHHHSQLQAMTCHDRSVLA